MVFSSFLMRITPREAHLGVPAVRSAAGTKIIYYDIHYVLLPVFLEPIIYFIEMSRKMREMREICYAQ